MKPNGPEVAPNSKLNVKPKTQADELSYGVFVGQPGHNPVEDASALSA
jgi:hypothetical protein